MDFCLGQLFLHHQLIGQIAAATAPLLIHLWQQKAMLAKPAPGLSRYVALCAPCGDMGREFAFHIATDLLTEGRDTGIHPCMLKYSGQDAHVHTPVRPPVHIRVWPLM